MGSDAWYGLGLLPGMAGNSDDDGGGGGMPWWARLIGGLAGTWDYNKKFQEAEGATKAQETEIRNRLRQRQNMALGTLGEGHAQQTQMSDDMYRRLMTQMGNLQTGMGNQYAARTRGITNMFGQREEDLLGRWDTDAADLLSGFQERYDRGMRNLAGLGQGERRDIDERFASRRSGVMSDMTNRGLTGSTVMQGGIQNMDRLRGNELSDLNERLQQQRLNLDARLSGDMLGAQQASALARSGYAQGLTGDTLNAWTGLTGDEYANRQNLGLARMDFDRSLMEGRMGLLGQQSANRIGLQTGLQGDLINFLQSIQHQYPNSGQLQNFWNAQGQQWAGSPDVGQNQWLPGAISGAGNLAGSAMMAAAL